MAATKNAKPKVPENSKNLAAVMLGRMGGAKTTSESASMASRARWGDPPRCGCGCGLTLGRAKWRHPARAFLAGTRPEAEALAHAE